MRSDNRAGIWLCDNEHASHWLNDNEHASQWLCDAELSIEWWICDPKPFNQDQKHHAPRCLRDQWPGQWASGPAVGQLPCSNQASCFGGPDHSRAEPNGKLHWTEHAEAQSPLHTCDSSSCKCKLAVVWPITANHCHWRITASDGLRRAASPRWSLHAHLHACCIIRRGCTAKLCAAAHLHALCIIRRGCAANLCAAASLWGRCESGQCLWLVSSSGTDPGIWLVSASAQVSASGTDPSGPTSEHLRQCLWPIIGTFARSGTGLFRKLICADDEAFKRWLPSQRGFFKLRASTRKARPRPLEVFPVR